MEIACPQQWLCSSEGRRGRNPPRGKCATNSWNIIAPTRRNIIAPTRRCWGEMTEHAREQHFANIGENKGPQSWLSNFDVPALLTIYGGKDAVIHQCGAQPQRLSPVGAANPSGVTIHLAWVNNHFNPVRRIPKEIPVPARVRRLPLKRRQRLKKTLDPADEPKPRASGGAGGSQGSSDSPADQSDAESETEVPGPTGTAPAVGQRPKPSNLSASAEAFSPSAEAAAAAAAAWGAARAGGGAGRRRRRRRRRRHQTRKRRRRRRGCGACGTAG